MRVSSPDHDTPHPYTPVCRTRVYDRGPPHPRRDGLTTPLDDPPRETADGRVQDRPPILARNCQLMVKSGGESGKGNMKDSDGA